MPELMSSLGSVFLASVFMFQIAYIKSAHTSLGEAARPQRSVKAVCSFVIGREARPGDNYKRCALSPWVAMGVHLL